MTIAVKSQNQRLIFMGTPEFSCPTLDRLIATGYDITCVYSQPPRPAGRGQKTQTSPVHTLALAHNIPVRTPLHLKDPAEQASFAALNADAAIVVAYGLILPPEILAAPRLGCFNLHASILPRWRGAAPIQRAIMAGDRESGVSIMQMERGLDTGPVLSEQRVVIEADTTAGDLHDRLSIIGADLMVTTLSDLFSAKITPRSQPSDGVTYAAKIDKNEAKIDWHCSSLELNNQIRGLAPHPGAWFIHQAERIKILGARPIDRVGAPGEVLDDTLTIGCGHGAIQLLKLQRQGRSALETADFLRGFPLAVGTILR